jgi:tetratricopeptide (TPR) repeat protein
MDRNASLSGFARFPRNEAGFSAYTFLGLVILAAVVIATILVFPWTNILHRWPDADFIAANDAMAQKDWKTAITFFDKSLKSNPGNAFAVYIGRSRAYIQLGNPNKALEEANAAVEMKPANATAYAQRGIASKLLHRNDEALRDFDEAVKLDHHYWWAYAQRADIRSRMNDQEKALKDVNAALAMKPDFVEGLRLRAWILNRMGKCKEAYKDFQKVSQLSPNDAWSLQDTAWFLLTCPDERVQDTSQALALAKKAFELPEGKDGIVYETLAEANFRQGNPIKAVELQKKAIEIGSKKCPDRSCTKQMEERLKKYELAAKPEVRNGYEILPMDSAMER